MCLDCMVEKSLEVFSLLASYLCLFCRIQGWWSRLLFLWCSFEVVLRCPSSKFLNFGMWNLGFRTIYLEKPWLITSSIFLLQGGDLLRRDGMYPLIVVIVHTSVHLLFAVFFPQIWYVLLFPNDGCVIVSYINGCDNLKGK